MAAGVPAVVTGRHEVVGAWLLSLPSPRNSTIPRGSPARASTGRARRSRPHDRAAGGRGGAAVGDGTVEAFSDGVLAIAITLLVLELRVPEGEPGELAGGLLSQWPSYVAYLASFVYVGVIWVSHHALYVRIAHVDSGLAWRNLALLLPASVLPFPTATVARALEFGSRGGQQAAIASRRSSTPSPARAGSPAGAAGAPTPDACDHGTLWAAWRIAASVVACPRASSRPRTPVTSPWMAAPTASSSRA